MKKINFQSGQACLISNAVDRKYFSQIDVDEGYLVLCPDTYYFIDARYYHAVEKALIKNDITPVLFNDISDIKSLLQKKNVKELFVDYDNTSVTDYNTYKSFGVEVLNISDEIRRLKSIKTQREIETIIRACDITTKALYKVIPNIKEGITERQVAEMLYKEFMILGASGTSFETIVAFGKNSAVPHHKTGDTRLEKNMAVLIDTGVCFNGYMSDITRTFFFGKPDKDFVDCYNLVLKANNLAEENITDGTLCNRADDLAREVFRQGNVDKYFTHSLGHGIGTEIHEYPFLSPKRKDRLCNGNVFTVEPGLYFNDKFGIRIEDTVMLLNGKVERLFTDNKELIILE